MIVKLASIIKPSFSVYYIMFIQYRYLRELKKEKTKEKEEKVKEAEQFDPDCPPGHIPLPNEVRLEHLKILKHS